MITSFFLLMGFFLQSCNSISTSARPVHIEVSPCVLDSETLTAECASRTGEWTTDIKLMDNWVCFNPYDARDILEK